MPPRKGRRLWRLLQAATHCAAATAPSGLTLPIRTMGLPEPVPRGTGRAGRGLRRGAPPAAGARPATHRSRAQPRRPAEDRPPAAAPTSGRAGEGRPQWPLSPLLLKTVRAGIFKQSHIHRLQGGEGDLRKEPLSAGAGGRSPLQRPFLLLIKQPVNCSRGSEACHYACNSP